MNVYGTIWSIYYKYFYYKETLREREASIFIPYQAPRVGPLLGGSGVVYIAPELYYILASIVLAESARYARFVPTRAVCKYHANLASPSP